MTKNPNDVITSWLLKELSEITQLDPKRLVYFTVSFRTFYKGWQEFQNGRYASYQEAEESAKNNSEHYVQALIKVHIGDTIVSLWEDGICLYADPYLEDLFVNNH